MTALYIQVFFKPVGTLYIQICYNEACYKRPSPVCHDKKKLFLWTEIQCRDKTAENGLGLPFIVSKENLPFYL